MSDYPSDIRFGDGSASNIEGREDMVGQLKGAGTMEYLRQLPGAEAAIGISASILAFKGVQYVLRGFKREKK